MMRFVLQIFAFIAIMLLTAGCGGQKTYAVQHIESPAPVQADDLEDTAAASPDTQDSQASDTQASDDKSLNVVVPSRYQLKGTEAITESTVTVTGKAFSPWDLIINNEEALRIVFLFEAKEIPYDSIEVRSDYFTITYNKGEPTERVVEFMPEGNVVYELYDKATGRRKAVGKITLE